MKLQKIDKSSLYRAANMEEATIAPFLGGMSAVYSKAAPSMELTNEDAAALIPYDDNCGVIAVADGMGGGPDGETAARLAIETLQSAIKTAEVEAHDLRNVILNAIEQANHRILDLGTGAGTTLSVVELQGNIMRPYHIGDSMILVMGQRGKVKLQTLSHAPVSYAVESGFLDESEAALHEDRHLVSNVLGSQEMRIEIGPRFKLAQRDTVVVASDGLSDNFYIDEIIELTRKGPLVTVASTLIHECLQRMTKPSEGKPSKLDDLTFVLYRPLSR